MPVVENVKMANFIATTLAEDVAIAEGDIDIVSATGLPTITGDEYFYLTFIRASDNAKEIVKVTAVSGTTLTCTRAQESTTALELLTGDVVELNVTVGLLEDMRDEITAELNKISFADASLNNHEDVTADNSIAKIIDDSIGDETTIHLGTGAFIFRANYTVPVGVTLVLEGNSTLLVLGSSTLTIAGKIIAPNRSIFASEAGSAVAVTSGQDIPAEWYGAVSYATTGEGNPVDSGEKIQTAFDQIGTSRLVLTDGYYYGTTVNILGNDLSGGNSELVIQQGAIFYSKSTITLACSIIAGRYQVLQENSGNHIAAPSNSYVLPEWYGAPTDGTTDATAALQFAIGSINAGATLDFRGSAIMNTSDDLDLYVPIRILGGTFIRTTTTGRAVWSLLGDDIVVEDMTIDVSGVTSGNCSGIYAFSADDLVLSNIDVISPRADGYSTGAFDSGIYLNDCDRCRVTSCTVTTPTKSGIAIEECENTLITACTVLTPTLVGIDIFNGVHNRVTNCTVKDSSDMGIRVSGLTSGAGEVDTATINNCTVQLPTQEAIVFDADTAPIGNTVVNGNTLIASDVLYTGVEFRGDVTDGLVVSNHIEGFSHGAGTTGAAANILVGVNHLMGCATETTFDSTSTNCQALANMKGATLTEAHAIIHEEENPGTQSQSSGGTYAWGARLINTIVADTAGMVASIDSSNGEFELIAGTYKIRAFAPVDGADWAQSRIRNVTSASTVAHGLNHSGAAGGDNDEANLTVVVGIVSIGSTTAFKIETMNNFGWVGGRANSNGERSVFTVIEITKISTAAIPTIDLTGENHVSYTFDASGGVAIGTHKIGELPDNAIVTRSWYEVRETFTSATDAGTISLGIATDAVAGIVAAKAISHGDNIWDDTGGPASLGQHEAIQDGTVANNTAKTTSLRDVQAIVAVEALLAGELTLHLTFTVSE